MTTLTLGPTGTMTMMLGSVQRSPTGDVTTTGITLRAGKLAKPTAVETVSFTVKIWTPETNCCHHPKF